ncbi:5367_t:CDS:2, partial [Gigaspora rosea]
LGAIPKSNIKRSKKIPVLINEIKGFKSEGNVVLGRSGERPLIDTIVMYSHEKSLVIEQGFDAVLEALLLQQVEINCSKESSKVYRKRAPIEVFRSIVVGSKVEKNIERRKDYIRGLIPNEVVDELFNRQLSRRVINKALLRYRTIVENGFFDEIWNKRCRSVVAWEKANGIATAMKRSGREKNITPVEDSSTTSKIRRSQVNCEQKSESVVANIERTAEVKRLFEEGVVEWIEINI